MWVREPQPGGPEAVPYELQLDGIRAIVRAGDLYEVESELIRNPVIRGLGVRA